MKYSENIYMHLYFIIKITLIFVDRVCFGNTDSPMIKDSELRYIFKSDTTIAFFKYIFVRSDTL